MKEQEPICCICAEPPTRELNGRRYCELCWPQVAPRVTPRPSDVWYVRRLDGKEFTGYSNGPSRRDGTPSRVPRFRDPPHGHHGNKDRGDAMAGDMAWAERTRDALRLRGHDVRIFNYGQNWPRWEEGR